MQLGSSGDGYVPQIAEEAWTTLNIEPDALGRIVDEVDRLFSSVSTAVFAEERT